MTTSLSVRYAYDQRRHDAENAAGRNYWYAYVAETLSCLGLDARPIALGACADPKELAGVGALILGDFPADCLPKGAAQALGDWVRAGAVLIGFATEGLDDVFGVEEAERISQADDAFAINGYLELRPDPVTTGCRGDIDPEQRLIIISAVRAVRRHAGRELGRLFRTDPECPDDGTRAHDAHAAVITHRALGEGHVFYFGFNLAQTLWAIQQGRPVDADYDGDGYWRVSDACVLGRNSLAVPYADALHFLLANMIGRRPIPMIHAVPPNGGRVAPALLFFSGDDEGLAGTQVVASDFFAGLGFPYHINAMPKDGEFSITPEEQARIEANGHEIALHFNFVTGFEHPGGFAREDVAEQMRLFRERFGRDSVCGNNHWCRWMGWSEPARWVRECGGLADNCRIHWTSPPLNPVNLIGFAFGSAFPRCAWDDAAHGNACLDFLILPIVAYEIGYEKEKDDPDKVREALDLAVRSHLTLNVFWHPCNVARYASCRRAAEELAALVKQMKVPPVLMGADEACRWWKARSRATIHAARREDGAVRLEAACDYPGGFVVRVPTGEAPVSACCVDGKAASIEVIKELGQWWALAPLGPGRHALELFL